MRYTPTAVDLNVAAERTPWSEVDKGLVWTFVGLMVLLALAMVFWLRNRPKD